MAQSVIVAKVTSLSGEAFARDAAGKVRHLKLGDTIREGESVVASDGSQVVLALADGREMTVRSGEVAKLDAEVAAQVKPDATDSALVNNPQGFQKIAKAIASGSSLDPLLDEDAPAAGVVVGGNEGHSFVEFLRIVETVSPLSFQFNANANAVLNATDAAPILARPTESAITVDAPDNTNDNTPTITGRALLPVGSIITLTITDSAGVVQTVSTPVTVGGGFSVDVPGVLADGVYTVVANGKDAAGNAATGSDTGSVDTTAPTLTALLDPTSDSGVKGDSITNDNTPTISGTGEPGAKIDVTIPGTHEHLTTTVGVDGKWTVTPTLAIPDGPITIPVVETDPAGNATSTTVPLTIDTTATAAPTVSITTDINNDGVINAVEQGSATTDAVKITLPGTAVAGDTLTISDGLTPQTHVLTAADIAAGNYVTTFAKPAEGGTLNVSATLTDVAGNTSPAGTDSAKLDTTATAAPTVTITTDANNDGFMNRSEVGSSTSVAVRVDIPADAKVGDTLTLTDGTTPQTHVLTAADLSAGSYLTSVAMPAEGTTLNVSATLTDAAGNVSGPGTDAAKCRGRRRPDPDG